MYVTMFISGTAQVIAAFCKRRILGLRKYLYVNYSA
jgi:hypothetical protein